MKLWFKGVFFTLATAWLLSAGSTAQAQDAAIALFKNVSSSADCSNETKNLEVEEGDTVYFCYRVRNVNNVTLNFHNLVDDQLGPLLTDHPFVLAPGDEYTYISPAHVVQFNGQESIVNEGTWTSAENSFTSPDTGLTAEAASIASVTLAPGDFSFDKTVSTTGSCPGEQAIEGFEAGAEVTYCYEIVNTGGRPLVFHDLGDSELGQLLDQAPVTVNPGDSYTFASNPVVIHQDTTNDATWTAFDETGIFISRSDSAFVGVAPAAISLLKTVSTANECGDDYEISVPPGTEVYYCYRVTNDSSFASYDLTQHSLVDDELGPLLTNHAHNLAPGASYEYIAGPVVIYSDTFNSAVWTATNPDWNLSANAGNAAFVDVVQAEISLEKTVGTDYAECATTDHIAVAPGTPVTYCYTVTNTSTVDSYVLNSHALEDSELGPIFNGLAHDLAPGESLSARSTEVVIDSDTVNTATWTAVNTALNLSAQASDSARVDIVLPSIALTKTVSTADECGSESEITISPSQHVYYCYTVSNTSPTNNVTLTHHDLYDDKLGQLLTNHPHDLAPGEYYSFIHGPVNLSQGLAHNFVRVPNIATWTARANVGGTTLTAEAGSEALVNVKFVPPDPVPAASRALLLGLALSMAVLGGLRVRRKRR